MKPAVLPLLVVVCACVVFSDEGIKDQNHHQCSLHDEDIEEEYNSRVCDEKGNDEFQNGACNDALQEWFQIGSDLHGKAANELFGWSVSSSWDGRIVAVAAIHNAERKGYSGDVRVYLYSNDDEEEDDCCTSSRSGGDDDGGDNNSNNLQLKTIHVNRSSRWSQIGSDIQGGIAGDYSGYSISLSGTGKTIAVGAPYSDASNGETSVGSVRVYRLYTTLTQIEGNGNDRPPLSSSNNCWVPVGEPINGENPSGGFGHSVALSSDGTTVVVGAPYDTNGDHDGEQSGRVRVYRLAYNKLSLGSISSGNAEEEFWEKVGADLHGKAAGDMFGYSVAISADGSIIAVGSKNHHGVNGLRSGLVQVYGLVTALSVLLDNNDRNEPHRWVPLGNDFHGEAGGDYSGFSVSLSADGTILAIGAPYHDGMNGIDSGRVLVYRYLKETKTWVRMGRSSSSSMDGEAMGDYFGYSVSLDANGRTIAIGARLNNGGVSGPLSGHVRVFCFGQEDDGDEWMQLGNDIDGEAQGDQSGFSVSLSGNGKHVVIGAPYNANNNNDNNGHVSKSAGHARIYACSRPGS